MQDLQEDTTGSTDALSDAWTVPNTIPPEDIEVFDGASWVPVASINTES